MSASQNNEGRHAKTRDGSADCKTLIEMATPSLFRTNAFRITGLPVDASIREITKQADKLKILEELGGGENAQRSAFALTPPPNVDQIREALQKLRDPEKRVIDELFWFWPEEFGKSSHDPAIQALAGGDQETALEIWMVKEACSTTGSTAMHNIAVLWNMVALEWEDYAVDQPIDDERIRKMESCWSEALKRWKHLESDESFWECVSKRLRQMDDARLTSGLVRRIRATLPLGLDKINALLALRYFQRGTMSLAQRHVGFMRETHPRNNSGARAAEFVLSAIEERLKQQIKATQKRGDLAPRDVPKAIHELLEHGAKTLAQFGLFFGPNSERTIDIGDEIASIGNSLQVAYHNATGDGETCLSILKGLLPFAKDGTLRKLLEANIGKVMGFLADKKLDSVYTLLKELQESVRLPKDRLEKFRREVIPSIASVCGAINVMDEFGPNVPEDRVELFDGAAIVLRGISLAAWNNHQDKATAVAANELALQHVCDKKFRAKLLEDQTTLRNSVPSRSDTTAKQDASKGSGLGCLVTLGIICGLFFVIWLSAKRHVSNEHVLESHSFETELPQFQK